MDLRLQAREAVETLRIRAVEESYAIRVMSLKELLGLGPLSLFHTFLAIISNN